MENYAPASTPVGEIPCKCCSFVIERGEESHMYVTTTEEKEENDLQMNESVSPGTHP